ALTRKRMETFDAVVLGHRLQWMDKNGKGEKPLFVRFNSIAIHVWSHPSPKCVQMAVDEGRAEEDAVVASPALTTVPLRTVHTDVGEFPVAIQARFVKCLQTMEPSHSLFSSAAGQETVCPMALVELLGRGLPVRIFKQEPIFKQSSRDHAAALQNELRLCWKKHRAHAQHPFRCRQTEWSSRNPPKDRHELPVRQRMRCRQIDGPGEMIPLNQPVDGS